MENVKTEKIICEKCGLDFNKIFKKHFHCPRCEYIQCLCGTENISIPIYFSCPDCGWNVFVENR